MSSNPELFGDEPAQTYYVQLSEEEKILPTYTKRKKSSKPLKGPLRTIYRNRKRIMRRIAQLLLFILVIYLLFTLYKYYSRKWNPFCTSESCQRTEKELLKSIDFETHPCKNFYKFACGNWAKHHPIPIDSADTSVIQIAQNKMITKISDFLLQSDSSHEPAIVHETRKFYKSCMKAGRSDGSSEFEQIAAVLKELHMPVIPRLNRVSEGFSWVRTVALSKKLYDKNIFFEFDIVTDPKNQSFNRILITKPLSTTTFSSFLKMDTRLFDPEHLGKMVDDDDIAELEKNPYYRLVKVSFRFACKAIRKKWDIVREKYFNSHFIFLMFFSSSIDHITNSYTNEARHKAKLYTIDSLQKLTNSIFRKHKKPPINWKQYLTWMFEGTNVTLDFAKKDTTILVSHVEYLMDVFRMIASVTEPTLETYLWWETVRGLISFTTSKLNNYEDQYTMQITGVQSKPRNLVCAEITNNLYGFATAYWIREDDSIRNNIPKVTEIADNIQKQFRKTIYNLEWLDDLTKNKAIKKLDSLTKKVGYPSWMEIDEYLNKYYENTSCSVDNFLENVYKLKREQMKWKLIYYRLQNDETDGWYSKFVLQTNAFYIMEKNSMIIPAGIFPYPFYQHGLEALNYGAIGMIIGHELTHGFDNTGKEFDGAGRLNSWWTVKTQQEFSKRAKCFVDEYNELGHKAIHLKHRENGSVTLNENIADNGGIQLAYYAYKDYLRRNGPEPLLPELRDFTSEQLFFLSFAHTWCEHKSKVRTDIETPEPHSSYAIRVLGTLKNFPEFANAWQCKMGSLMSPKREKCQLW